MRYIFLHGLGQTPTDWNNTFDVMENKKDIVCPDLSKWLLNKTSCYLTLYHALEKYCESFHEPLNLCGLSLGGILAMQYGIEHPDKVNSLVLIGTQYIMPKRLLKLQNILFRFMPNSTFSDMGFQKADFISLCNSMTELDFQQNLKDIHCRVLIVCGEKDKANKSASLQMKELIPNAELVIINNAGHEVNKDQPIELGKQLNTFFEL